MLTAIDSNVLFDVFLADPKYAPRSKAAVRQALHHGRLVACDVVWAEVASVFPSVTVAKEAMDRLSIELSAVTLEGAFAAGTAWKGYRARGGKRERLVADFLIGGHALAEADQLLTRDRGFYRVHFAKLKVIEP